jgi:hypothetical protein
MINFNDHLGGGNNITTSLLFNTCRESGDHGPANSWNRMPFLTSIASGGGVASYTPALTETTGMFVIANYGGAQGYDNDDGSSEEHIRNNFFYQADGLKMCVVRMHKRNLRIFAKTAFFSHFLPTLTLPCLPGTMEATTPSLRTMW